MNDMSPEMESDNEKNQQTFSKAKHSSALKSTFGCKVDAPKHTLSYATKHCGVNAPKCTRLKEVAISSQSKGGTHINFLILLAYSFTAHATFSGWPRSARETANYQKSTTKSNERYKIPLKYETYIPSPSQHFSL